MGTDSLFQSVKVGSCHLEHRVVLSAMTRLRNDPVTEALRDMNINYYLQRTTKGGLLVTEGASPSPSGRGYIRAPNLYDEPNLTAWRKLTEAVHKKGGFIFAQVMHAGRVSHSSLLPGERLPVAPSAVKMAGQVHVEGGKADYEVPHALTKEEIPDVVTEFAKAAKNAVDAGFDGVELHAGNGYILQQFLAQATNQRTDEYGGPVENRARFLLEVVDACCAAIGSARVGLKLQPGVTFSDLVEREADCMAQLAHLAAPLQERRLAYVQVSSLNYDPYYKFAGLPEPNFKEDVFRFFRRHYKGVFMINGGLSPEKAAEYVTEGTADLVAFGVLFLANANLPALIATAGPISMAGADPSTWYGRDPADDEKHYTDWPLIEVPNWPPVRVAAS